MVRASFTVIHPHYLEFVQLAVEIPGTYMKFYNKIRLTTQHLLGLAAYVVFLESQELLTTDNAYQFFGFGVKEQDMAFNLDEDMLFGYAYLIKELARLSLNCVSYYYYALPFQISEFTNMLYRDLEEIQTEIEQEVNLNELNKGKKDKIFEALKSIDEVQRIVYDLTIRGIKPDKHEM